MAGQKAFARLITQTPPVLLAVDQTEQCLPPGLRIRGDKTGLIIDQNFSGRPVIGADTRDCARRVLKSLDRGLSRGESVFGKRKQTDVKTADHVGLCSGLER